MMNAIKGDRGLIGTLLLFGSAALIGPIIASLVRAANGYSTVPFFYELTLLLWPAQVFAIMEASIGRMQAFALAVSINVVLFLIFGLLRYWLRDSRRGLVGLSALVCAG